MSRETQEALNGVRILVVDDDPDLLELLGEWLSCFGASVQSAPDGFKALALVKQQPFDVAVTDLQMPGLSGLQLLSLFKELDPSLEVIFLTGQGTMEDAIQALREGRAFDFLQKPLRDLHQLNQTITKAIGRRQSARAQQAPVPPPDHIEILSPREHDIVSLLAEGLDNRDIADRLVLSEKTVKNHLTRIYEKLKVSNRTQAVLFCKQYGLLERRP